ncbi:hypothetical protein J2Y41_004253 [Arthrobacter sp. 1088]|nr:hypothetical protein [Arthrobacter sp. 1088]
MKGLGRVLGSVANSVPHNAPCGVYIANTYDADQFSVHAHGNWLFQ